MNEELRKKVKLLKALQNIPYKEIAEYIEITNNSMYSWIHGNYELSDKKEKQLNEVINTLKEG